LPLIENRVRECFWLFSMSLPIGENQTQKLIDNFGEDISKELPKLISKMAQVCMTYPEDFDGYLEFIIQSIIYMRGDSDELPELDVTDYNRMIMQMRIQLGEYKPKKDEK